MSFYVWGNKKVQGKGEGNNSRHNKKPVQTDNHKRQK